ncbi:MAG: ribosome small subunit-dependent GTPase A [Chitinivibrionales bacterium]|nr:ribosome small subunit-dependent GTPase A [Chitinivibrionales bacterium]
MFIDGRVVEEQKNYYVVDTDHGRIRSFLKGVIKKSYSRLLVGDRVRCELYEAAGEKEALIRQVHPRTSELQKPAVANVNHIFYITTSEHPCVDAQFNDKFLFAAAVLEFSAVTLVFNKVDLLTLSQRQELESQCRYYEALGYPWFFISAITGEGIDSLINHAQGKISIVAGASGVGKTSILAKLFPEYQFKIAELSKNTDRGKHTTTCTALLKLSEESFIADTPGFSYFEAPTVAEYEVVAYLQDIVGQQGRCRFSTCTHINEPGCFIKELVEQGVILGSRYDSYVKLYQTMYERNRNYSKREYR